MKIKELKKELGKYPSNMEVIVFASGSLYPTLEVALWEGDLQIGCGWADLDEKK